MWLRNSAISAAMSSVLPTMSWVVALIFSINVIIWVMVLMVVCISSPWTSMSFIRSSM